MPLNGKKWRKIDITTFSTQLSDLPVCYQAHGYVIMVCRSKNNKKIIYAEF